MIEEIAEKAPFHLIAMPSSLCDRVVLHVRQAEQNSARRNSFICLGLAFVSFTLCVGAAFWLWGDLNRGEFFRSFSLIFSDSSFVFAYWQDFTSTLVEAFPFVSTASCFLALSVSVASVYALMKYRAQYADAFGRTKVGQAKLISFS